MGSLLQKVKVKTRLQSSEDLKLFSTFSFQLETAIMRYIASAILASLGGKSIDADNIKSILGSVGIEAEQNKVDLVVKELAGKNIEELIAEGQSRLASMPTGGGGGSMSAVGGASAPAEGDGVKEEKKEEPEEESDDDMGFGLFD